jgi:hypothetical protein
MIAARTALYAGAITPWKRDNARRADTRKKHKPRPLIRHAPAVTGQLDLFATRPPTRIRDHAGGYLSPVAGMELDHIRRRNGETWDQLAARCGVSRPTLINARQGRFPLSGWAMNRVREAVYSAPMHLPHPAMVGMNVGTGTN